MSTSIDALIPELQQPCRDLVNLAGGAGVQPRITSTLRSHSEQTALYKRFLAGNSAYPAAPPGRSAHEFGYAFDMVVVGSENQNDLGTVWRNWGGVWDRSDVIHFEYPGFVPPEQDPGLQQSWQEQIASMFAPFALSLAQMLAEAFPDLDPDISYAVLHPWTGMDWAVPQFLLDWRKKIMGI